MQTAASVTSSTQSDALAPCMVLGDASLFIDWFADDEEVAAVAYVLDNVHSVAH